MTNVTLPPPSSPDPAASAGVGGAAASPASAPSSLPVPPAALPQSLANLLVNQGSLAVQGLNVTAGGLVTLTFAAPNLPEVSFQLGSGQATTLLTMLDSGLAVVLSGNAKSLAQAGGLNAAFSPVLAVQSSTQGAQGLPANAATPAAPAPGSAASTLASAISSPPSVVLNIRAPTITAWPAPSSFLASVPVSDLLAAVDNAEADAGLGPSVLAAQAQQAVTPVAAALIQAQQQMIGGGTPSSAAATAPMAASTQTSLTGAASVSDAAAGATNPPAAQGATPATIATPQNAGNSAVVANAQPVPSGQDSAKTAIADPLPSAATAALAGSDKTQIVLAYAAEGGEQSSAPAVPQQPALFTLVSSPAPAASGPAAGGVAEDLAMAATTPSSPTAGAGAMVVAQLPNELTVLKMGGGLWLTSALPDVPPGTALSLAYAGPAPLSALPDSFARLEVLKPFSGGSQQQPALPPGLATLVQAAMPQGLVDPGLSMAVRAEGAVFLLLTVLQGGFPARLLQGNAQALEDMPEALRTAMAASLARWQADAAGSQGALVSDQAGRFWQAAQLPGLPFVWPLPMQLLIQRQATKGGKDERRKKGRKVRFVIDVRFSHFGATQFDGLADTKNLDLAIRSERTLETNLKHQLSVRYSELAAACGFSGRLSFQDGTGALLRWQNQGAGDSLLVEA